MITTPACPANYRDQRHLEAQGKHLSVHTQLSETYWNADHVCIARFEYRFQIPTGEVIFKVVDFSCR